MSNPYWEGYQAGLVKSWGPGVNAKVPKKKEPSPTIWGNAPVEKVRMPFQATSADDGQTYRHLLSDETRKRLESK